MSLRLAPESSELSTVSSTKFGPSAPSAPGLQDTLRTNEGPLSIASKINNRHPLEARLANWEKNEIDTKMETYRRIFGAAEPIRRTMELQIVESDFVPRAVGGDARNNIHRDILLGKDTSLDWEDIYTGRDEIDVNFHSEMEKKMGI